MDNITKEMGNPNVFGSELHVSFRKAYIILSNPEKLVACVREDKKTGMCKIFIGIDNCVQESFLPLGIPIIVSDFCFTSRDKAISRLEETLFRIAYAYAKGSKFEDIRTLTTETVEWIMSRVRAGKIARTSLLQPSSIIFEYKN